MSHVMSTSNERFPVHFVSTIHLSEAGSNLLLLLSSFDYATEIEEEQTSELLMDFEAVSF